MKLMNLKHKVLAVAAAVSVVIMLPAGVMAAANGKANPQAPTPGARALATAVPDQCVLQKLLNPDEQKYRLTYNAPFTYTTTGGSFFNVKCGALTFTVPRGQDALVDFTAAGELDCQAPNNVTTAGANHVSWLTPSTYCQITPTAATHLPGIRAMAAISTGKPTPSTK
jgi:hypothetical protein